MISQSMSPNTASRMYSLLMKYQQLVKVNWILLLENWEKAKERQLGAFKRQGCKEQIEARAN